MRRLILPLFAILVTAAPVRAEIIVQVDKAAQRMAVSVDGMRHYYWHVSTGLGGGPPVGTFRPQRLEKSWHSRKYHMAPMPYAVFFHDNYAIHGTPHVKQLGQRASKGCVRLHPENASMLFSLIQQHGMGATRIVVGSGVPETAEAPAIRKRSPRVKRTARSGNEG